MNWDIARWLLVLVGVLLIIAPVYLDRWRAANSRPVPDTSVIDAVNYLVSGSWSASLDWESNPAPVNDAMRKLEQAASDGRITIFGRQQLEGTRPLVPVPADHWRTFRIGVLGYVNDVPVEPRSVNRSSGHKTFESYEDLQLAKSEINGQRL